MTHSEAAFVHIIGVSLKIAPLVANDMVLVPLNYALFAQNMQTELTDNLKTLSYRCIISKKVLQPICSSIAIHLNPKQARGALVISMHLHWPYFRVFT